MALQSLAGGLVRWPGQLLYVGGIDATIDADGEYMAAIYRNDEVRTLRGLTLFVRSVSVSGDLRITVETVGSNGLPSGTLIDAAATKDVTVSAVQNYQADFGAEIDLPVGLVAFVVKRVGGSFVGTVRYRDNITFEPVAPYSVSNGTIVLAPPTSLYAFTGAPPDETYLVFAGARAPSYGDGIDYAAANVEIGVLVTIPHKARAYGIDFHGHQVATPSQSPEVRLYASNGSTLLASGVFDSPVRNTTAPHRVPFGTPAEISPGSYYCVVHGFDGSFGIGPISQQIRDHKLAYVTGRSGSLKRTGSGAFTEQNAYVAMALVLDQLDDGVQVQNARAQTVLGVV